MATSTADRKGTLAKARGIRMSASKARIVLDLIRGKSVTEAMYILEFSERLASEPILKVLKSAIANAVHNDDQTEEELFVSECFADGGPTIKRFRPRARGRGAQIQKKTCHITVVVARFSEDELDAQREREDRRSKTSSPKKPKTSDAAARRKRVAKSKSDAAADESPQDDIADVSDDSVEPLAEETPQDADSSQDQVSEPVAAEDAEPASEEEE